MSFANGGRIVTDGLVLSLDASDKNSLSDEPVINLIGTNPTPTSTSGFVFSGPTSYTMSYNATEQAMEFETDNTAVWGWYFYNNSLFNTPLSASSLHSTSFEWKTGPRNTYTSSLQHQIITGEGTSASLNTTITTNPSSQTGSYAKLSHTFTPASAGINGNRQYRIIGQAFASGSSRIHLFWRKLQLEQNDHSTTFVSGSRNTWVDLSGKNNSGTLFNNPIYNSGSNGSIVFDGSDDKVVVPYISSYNLTNLTVLVWIKPISPQTSPSSYGFRHIISKQGADRDWNFYLYSSSNNDIVNYFHLSTARASIYNSLALIPGGSLLLNTWHQCGFSISEGLLKYYLNGSIINQGSTDFSSANNSYPISIGGADNYTKGNIATTQVYNRGLSASEVLQNYNASKSRFNLK
jgi:hypothetical protein